MPLLPFPELGICLSHVEDIAAGILLAPRQGQAGRGLRDQRPGDDDARGDRDVVAEVTGRKAPKRAMPTGLMKAMIPIGPLVGKLMGQPPNLRELISSADGVTFWASYEKASASSATSRAASKRACGQTLEAEGSCPSPPRAA